MLQSHSIISPSYVLSIGFDFRARVTAPQWQPPVYIFAPSISAGGSWPSNLGGLHAGGVALSSSLVIRGKAKLPTV